LKFIVLFFILYSSLFSLQVSDKLFECTEIFKERKSELLVELERIDEQKQALNALKVATESLLKQKESKLSQEEDVVNKKLSDIDTKEKNIKKMLDKNEKILKDLKDTKMSMIAQTYSKMKPAASASILSDMPPMNAVMILQSLKPKVVGKILTKMSPDKASGLTQMLSK